MRIWRTGTCSRLSVAAERGPPLGRYVVVGATVAAAVLTPSTDPFTQMLLAGPLIGLYLGGASLVKVLEQSRRESPA